MVPDLPDLPELDQDIVYVRAGSLPTLTIFGKLGNGKLMGFVQGEI